MLLRLSNIAYVDTLVARTEWSVVDRRQVAKELPKGLAQLSPNGDGVHWAAAHVIDLSSGTVDALDGAHHEFNQVVNVEQIADLLAITVNRDTPTAKPREGEVGYPSLVFVAELAWTVNAGHSQNDCGETIDAMVVANVLVGGALRAAIRGMKIKRAGFGDPVWPIGEFVASVALHHSRMLDPAVDFIGRSEQHDGPWLKKPRCFQHVKSSQGVDLKIFLGVRDRSGHSNLRGKMEDHLRASHRFFERVEIPYVSFHELKTSPVLPAEPREVLLNTRAAEIVEKDDVVSLAKQSIRQITADEADSTRNERSHRFKLLR